MTPRMLSLCAGAAALFAAATAHAQDTIKIGVIMPYSGIFAATATQMEGGLKLYLKQHGNRIAGKKIEIIRKDVGGINPPVAKRLAQELITRDHVDILAGFVLTPNALAAADVSKQAKVPLVIMNAATSIITTRSPYSVRVSLTIPQIDQPFGVWAAKHGVKNVYTMVSDYGPGHDAEKSFIKGFTSAGGKIVGSVRMPVANPDFSAFVQKAKDSGAKAVFVFIPAGSQPASLLNTFLQRGVTPKTFKILGEGELTDDSALDRTTDDAVGVITAYHYDHTHESALNKKFVTAYRAANKNQNPDLLAVGGYDGMHLIYAVLKKTGGKADGQTFIATAKGMSWESPRGVIKIDPATRDVVQTVYIRKVVKVGGRLQNKEIDKIENVKDPVKEAMMKK
jgi:branched-chain amino acid transport system substrate-binding protein